MLQHFVAQVFGASLRVLHRFQKARLRRRMGLLAEKIIDTALERELKNRQGEEDTFHSQLEPWPGLQERLEEKLESRKKTH